jgi:hypothetical protein
VRADFIATQFNVISLPPGVRRKRGKVLRNVGVDMIINLLIVSVARLAGAGDESLREPYAGHSLPV